MLRILVKSHTLNGACRTVGEGEIAGKNILHHVCDMARNPRSFL